MNWAELTLIGFGLFASSAVATYIAFEFFHAAWELVVHWKRDYQLYSNAYGRGFQEGYDAFRNDAGLPPLPSSRIPKERNVK